jgi:hypothetical protein
MYGVRNVKGHVFEIWGRVYITIPIDSNHRGVLFRAREEFASRFIWQFQSIYLYALLMRLASISVFQWRSELL